MQNTNEAWDSHKSALHDDAWNLEIERAVHMQESASCVINKEMEVMSLTFLPKV